MHEFSSWDWADLTFRAVAERAGVGERTVYRHFPSERHLHDAVMQQLEHEAGVTYEEVDLKNLVATTARIFQTRQSFAAKDSVVVPQRRMMLAADERRKLALLRAVESQTPDWSDEQRRLMAALLDVLWHLPSHERMVSGWGIPSDDAAGALVWLMQRLIDAVEDNDPPSVR